MKYITAPIVLLVAALVPLANATTLNIGPTNETVVFTGLGNNSLGEGQATVTFGNCTFDGTNTNCTLTGPYTGLGTGGTFSILFQYKGNGTAPLTATALAPGGNLTNSVLGPGALAFVTTLKGNDGTTTNFYYTFYNFVDNPAAVCTKVPTCSYSQVGAVPGATFTERVTGTLDLTPMITSVISAGQYGGFTALSPGTWMEIYGYNLGTVLARTWGGNDFNGLLAPTNLAGTSVTVGGKPAFVDYVSPSQVNAQVPTGIGTGFQPVVVTSAGGSSFATSVMVNTVQPGLLAPTAFQLPAGHYIAALLPDGVTFVLPPGITSAVPTSRARVGSTIILYGVGFGLVTPDNPAGQITQGLDPTQMPFQVSFGGVPATVTYAGLVSGYVGLYQFNVVVPNVPASDAVPVTFTLGGTKGQQNLIIPVQ